MTQHEEKKSSRKMNIKCHTANNLRSTLVTFDFQCTIFFFAFFSLASLVCGLSRAAAKRHPQTALAFLRRRSPRQMMNIAREAHVRQADNTVAAESRSGEETATSTVAPSASERRQRNE